MANIDWGRIGKILSDQRTWDAVGAVGAGISASQANNQRQQQLDQSALQFAQQMALQQRQLNLNNNPAIAAANASPLGANENFAADQAFRSMILRGMQNPSVTPTDPGVAAAMPRITPAFQLPSGGVPQEVLRHLSPEATAGAIAQRQGHIANIDPNASGVNFNRMGFGAEASGAQADADGYGAASRERMTEGERRTERQLQQALQSQGQEKKKGSLMSKLGTVIKIAAPIVLAATGVGAPAAAAWMAAANVAGSRMQGQDWGNSLRSGAIGAATGAVGAGALGAGSGAATGANAARAGFGTALRQAGVNASANAIFNLNQRGATPPPPQTSAPPPAIDPQLLQAALRRRYIGA